ncbi:MAG: sigma-54 dependent transcriptional regulator [Candidatus Caldarchaeum sp.]
MKPKVLVIDDEKGVRESLSMILAMEGYRVFSASSAIEALELIDGGEGFDFIISDIRMPEMDGMALLKELKARDLDSSVIMISAYGNIETSIEAVRHGASDYINKPINPDELILRMRMAEERRRLRSENLYLKRRLTEDEGFQGIVYSGKKMGEVIELAKRVAQYKTTILITGESGTGKEVLARAIHNASPRKDKPFVAVNCAAIPESLFESELFGYARGAFSGANESKKGLIEEADGGTLFLDEIGEFPLSLQPKLLRMLQEEEIRRLGETRTRRVDVRIIAASSQDLDAKVGKGSFREDLFYRLNVVPIKIPPLRERKEDIPGLIRHFIEKYNAKFGKGIKGLSQGALSALLANQWRGNVRELENAIERAVILSDAEVIDVIEGNEPAPHPKDTPEMDPLKLRNAWREVEANLIKKALSESGNNRTQAARLLGISRRSLLYKMKEYGINEKLEDLR